MRIAKLRISIPNAGIQYNSAEELETTKKRGDVLTDGKVVRGLGTHFASLESKERWERLTARSNVIRTMFNKNFVRGMFDGSYYINEPGGGKRFAEQFQSDRPDIEVDVFEYDLTGEGSEKELNDWAQRIKTQILKYPLGRGSKLDAEGLAALRSIATCPALAKETQEAILSLVGNAETGIISRGDLKEGLGKLKVQLDSAVLVVPRAQPMPV
jgi:hypothetical protein